MALVLSTMALSPRSSRVEHGDGVTRGQRHLERHVLIGHLRLDHECVHTHSLKLLWGEANHLLQRLWVVRRSGDALAPAIGHGGAELRHFVRVWARGLVVVRFSWNDRLPTPAAAAAAGVLRCRGAALLLSRLLLRAPAPLHFAGRCALASRLRRSSLSPTHRRPSLATHSWQREEKKERGKREGDVDTCHVRPKGFMACLQQAPHGQGKNMNTGIRLSKMAKLYYDTG
ncbi:hypothetical protein [Oryza sativa Japonica Group]|uniref:Uncharacterized protein n=1 Tax=Oryza sativa subsp. japonica TaxID=39947 RepID=Q5ZCU8_ORYSJ|nr:hypothetical protein [Oryza sativa Japonica Group]